MGSGRAHRPWTVARASNRPLSCTSPSTLDLMTPSSRATAAFTMPRPSMPPSSRSAWVTGQGRGREVVSRQSPILNHQSVISHQSVINHHSSVASHQPQVIQSSVISQLSVVTLLLSVVISRGPSRSSRFSSSLSGARPCSISAMRRAAWRSRVSSYQFRT